MLTKKKFLIKIAATVVVALLLATIATALTIVIEAKVVTFYPDVMGCETSCLSVAGGWPFPYLVDYPLSPVGSVSLIGGIVGTDVIWVKEMVHTLLFWFGIATILVWIAVRKR